MDYVLHYAPDNASLIVRLTLEQGQIPYETRLVDRGAQAQRGAAYRALNPKGLIPTLETPEGPIFETGAILLWLADRHGGLFPAPASPARGKALKWFFHLSNTMHPLARMMFYGETYVDAACLPDFYRRSAEHFAQAATLLDGAAPEWSDPEAPGIADFYAAALMRWPALYPRDADRSWFDLARWPALARVAARVEGLPACRALQSAEGLGDTPFTAPRYPDPPEGSAL